MASAAEMRAKVRLGLGDRGRPFRTPLRGDGDQDDFDLQAVNIDLTSVTVFRLNEDDSITTYDTPADYVVDSATGVITFTDPIPDNDLLMVEGRSYGLFTDTEVDAYVEQALFDHAAGRQTNDRYRDGRGFIRYDRQPIDTLDLLPDNERSLVSALAVIEGLWDLSTDASKDINVSTSEGTQIPRGQRFAQITQQIDRLTEWYKTKSLALGVGLYAPEVVNLRRVSRGTGRLVPLFADREYDETGEPNRLIPSIPRRDENRDGPPSPWYPGGFGP